MASTLENNGNLVDSEFLSSKGPLDGRIRATKIDRRYFYEPFNQNPIVVADIGGGAATGTAGDVNIMWTGYTQFEVFVLGTQTILGPTLTSTGLNVAYDLTNNDGIELVPGSVLTSSPYGFKVGTDSAFFTRLKMKITDVSGADELYVGFRNAEAGQADLATYTDLALIGNVSGDIKIATNLNDATSVSITDTTENWADGETHTVAVKVSSTGVTTFEIDGAAPDATATFTFDTGDTVIPMFRLLHDSDVSETTELIEWETGLQPSSRVTLV